MNEPGAKVGIENRRSERVDLSERVTIELPAATLTGTGDNISEQGVFFRADASIPVRVRIGDSETVVHGELVRVENIGDGSIGIAVRFAAPNPDLLPATD